MSALDTFRRTMRRHERRARRMGLVYTAEDFASIRNEPDVWGYNAPEGLCEQAEFRREIGSMTAAFLYDRAADAVAKLRAAGGAP